MAETETRSKTKGAGKTARSSPRERKPSAAAINDASGGDVRTQKEIEQEIMDPNPKAGEKRGRAASDNGAGGGRAKKKGAAPKTGFTKKELEKFVRLEKKHAPETVHLELPSVFIRLLCSIKVDEFQWDINKDKPIFVCNQKDTVANVFRGLIRHNLQSVPVTTKDMEKYFAFIDLSDIVRYVVEHFGDAKASGEEKNFWDLVKEEGEFEKVQIQKLEQHPYASKNRYHAVQIGSSMYTVFEAMAKLQGLRRVAVVDAKRSLLNLITQSQLVSFRDQNVDLLGAKGRKTLDACPHFKKAVITIKESDKAIDGFRLMNRHNLNGIGIVDETGRLKGNLSTRDLKVISGEARLFWRLNQTVKNFVLHLRQEFQTTHGRPQRLVYAHMSDTLIGVIKKLEFHKVHRLYIVDERRQPIGLVSLRDLLAEIVTESQANVNESIHEYRQALASLDIPREVYEGVEFEKAELEPLIPPRSPKKAAAPAAVAASAPSASETPVGIVPGAPTTIPGIMFGMPTACCPTGALELLAKAPIQITDFGVPAAALSGRNIEIQSTPQPHALPQVPGTAAPSGGAQPTSATPMAM